ncbi:hypothetical protein Pryu01_01575 [Paraliobacillus ryukyuensis]|uniref:Uncharacterized protein n=1 Tax=Paraliobacillus ryukyuensis TaxID=200904 RepID=A0A366EES4_9BACI|nr:hypothetical protein [Paraliobacillus ryukyuensis]RBO99918.1 hypothetical protein DES48_103246 [Paraliobacillus ryukyuensis]
MLRKLHYVTILLFIIFGLISLYFWIPWWQHVDKAIGLFVYCFMSVPVLKFNLRDKSALKEKIAVLVLVWVSLLCITAGAAIWL